METLRGLSTRKQCNALLSQRYKKNIVGGGGSTKEGGVAGHQDRKNSAHTAKSVYVTLNWLLPRPIRIYNNHFTNFNSLDRMMLNSSSTSSLIGIVKPCFYYRRPKTHPPGLGNVLRRQLKSKWPKHRPKDFHLQGHFLFIGCVSGLLYLGPKERNTTTSLCLVDVYWDGWCFERTNVWAGNVYRAHQNTDR